MSLLPKVNVLLAAYNGEKYIQQQIESILRQTYDNIHLLIRDDGSTDHTRTLLKEYEQQEKITVLYGENVGHTGSFLKMLDYDDTAEYYAYCDQDDVWNPDKIESAVKMLQEEDAQIPLLYFSNYDYYDAEMQFVRKGNTGIPKPSFANSLVEPLTLGFTQVFNARARNCILSQNRYPVYGHDWWTYMVCAGMGKVIYDSVPRVKYRRHAENVSFGGAGFWKKQKLRLRKYFKGNQFLDMKHQCDNMLAACGECMKQEDKKLLQAFVDDSVSATWKKLCYPHRYRQSLPDEIMIRLIFLLKKI